MVKIIFFSFFCNVFSKTFFVTYPICATGAGSRPVATHLQVGRSLVATGQVPPPGEPPPPVPLARIGYFLCQGFVANLLTFQAAGWCFACSSRLFLEHRMTLTIRRGKHCAKVHAGMLFFGIDSRSTGFDRSTELAWFFLLPYNMVCPGLHKGSCA